MTRTMHNPPHPGELLREYLGSMPVGEAAKRLPTPPQAFETWE